MICTTGMILEKLGKDYSNPRGKLQRLVRDGDYIPIVQGLYETDRNISGHLLAGAIRNPSYLSFEYALSFYGMIPEMVRVYTSATTRTHRSKMYTTPFGTYTFRDVPVNAFRWGQRQLDEGGVSFWIATREKALCDELYIKPPVNSVQDIEDMLFDDLRVYEDEFDELDIDDIIELAPKYRSSNTRLLADYLKVRYRWIQL